MASLTKSSTNSEGESFGIEVYSLNEGDHPMRRNRRATLDDGVGLSGSDHTSHTGSSSRRTFRDRLAAMNISRPVARSFDALDPNSSVTKSDILEGKPILKESTSVLEMISPAPESPTDDSDSCSFKNDHRDYDNELTHLEAGTGRDGNTSGKSNRRVLFEDPSGDNIDGSYHSRASRRGSASSMGRLTRQISQYLLPQNTDRRKSLTAQRYSRRQSVVKILTSDVSEALGNMEPLDDLSDDTVHRLKAFFCCVAFALVLSALLYYMLKD